MFQKIFIVDDSSIIRKALSRQLEKFGARVTQAEDGLEGLQQALAGNIDLLISDVELEEAF
jgi:CheY-like chemotaxis protein